MSGSFKDHFSARSADYARFRPRYPPGLVDYLADLAPGRGLALDCGCGAGQLSMPLAGAFRQVAATDASPQQIASAAPHPAVRYAARRADDSGLDDHRVIGPYWPPERRHVETGYRLLPFPFTEQTPPPAAGRSAGLCRHLVGDARR